MEMGSKDGSGGQYLVSVITMNLNVGFDDQLLLTALYLGVLPNFDILMKDLKCRLTCLTDHSVLVPFAYNGHCACLHLDRSAFLSIWHQHDSSVDNPAIAHCDFWLSTWSNCPG
ncbi:BSD domain-containing protein [Psidium guajava]|nr:BSD domain-containing protein [Psidium guajava]